MRRFADRIGANLLAAIPRDGEVVEAERRCLTVFDHAPDSASARALGALAEALVGVVPDRISPPSPMSEQEFFELMRG